MSEKISAPPEPEGAFPYPESLVIVTGLSGSGKSYVNKVLEDMGYFCVDNLPLEMVEPLLSRRRDVRQQAGGVLLVQHGEHTKLSALHLRQHLRELGWKDLDRARSHHGDRLRG